MKSKVWKILNYTDYFSFLHKHFFCVFGTHFANVFNYLALKPSEDSDIWLKLSRSWKTVTWKWVHLGKAAFFYVKGKTFFLPPDLFRAWIFIAMCTDCHSLFLSSFILSFFPQSNLFLLNHCRCRGLLLHLIAHSDAFTLVRSPLD